MKPTNPLWLSNVHPQWFGRGEVRRVFVRTATVPAATTLYVWYVDGSKIVRRVDDTINLEAMHINSCVRFAGTNLYVHPCWYSHDTRLLVQPTQLHTFVTMYER